MTSVPGRGVAYDFWRRVKAEQAKRGWTDQEMYNQSGVARTTIDRLEKGRPQAKTVNALAKALGIDQAEAHQLAGLVPVEPAEPEQGAPRISVREAIMSEPAYSAEDRETLLRLLDMIDRGKGS